MRVRLRFTIGIAALIFCGWALWASGLKMVGFASLITLSGIPIYIWKNKNANTEIVVGLTGE